MALSFTDSQVKTISGDILDLPLKIDFPLDPVTNTGGTGLVQQKDNVLVAKDALYVTDQQNKLFSDHWKNSIDSYHAEYEILSLNKRTNYNPTDLENGGQSLPPHYTPSHPELVPIVIDSNNGNPISPSAITENETPKLDRMDSKINVYLNGLGGVLDDFLDASWVNGSPVNVLNGTAFTAGETVIVVQGVNAMLATISGSGSCTGETPAGSGINQATCIANGGTWSNSVSLIPITAPKVFTIGAKIQNYSPAFTDAQRGRQTALTVEETAIMELLESEIDLKILEVHDFIAPIVTIVTNNEDNNATRKTNNQNYLGALNNIVSSYDTWDLELLNSKYTDAKLLPIQSLMNSLRTLNPNRSNEIVTMLGSVTDNGGGNITGNGAYFDLWKFIVIRISKSGGTLYSWYSMGLAVTHFDTKIANANSQLNEYSNIFIVKKITADVLLGTSEVIVENILDLSQNDSIKIFDNNTPVFNTSISSITGNTITLSQSVPSEMLVGNKARIVKYV